MNFREFFIKRGIINDKGDAFKESFDISNGFPSKNSTILYELSGRVNDGVGFDEDLIVICSILMAIQRAGFEKISDQQLFIDQFGELIIPFSCNEEYRGVVRGVTATVEELIELMPGSNIS
jgi:hypothetical protein